MDYQGILYDPAYAAIGVTATLTSASGTTADVTVIDKTSGIAVADRTLIETLKPAAAIRAVELASVGIEISDLDGGQIIFNGFPWGIKSVRAAPSPNGEADGEYLMILNKEPT